MSKKRSKRSPNSQWFYVVVIVLVVLLLLFAFKSFSKTLKLDLSPRGENRNQQQVDNNLEGQNPPAEEVVECGGAGTKHVFGEGASRVSLTCASSQGALEEALMDEYLYQLNGVTVTRVYGSPGSFRYDREDVVTYNQCEEQFLELIELQVEDLAEVAENEAINNCNEELAELQENNEICPDECPPIFVSSNECEVLLSDCGTEDEIIIWTSGTSSSPGDETVTTYTVSCSATAFGTVTVVCSEDYAEAL